MTSWPLNKGGISYLGSLKLVVSTWLLSGSQNGHKIFLGQWEASGKGKTAALPLCHRATSKGRLRLPQTSLQRKREL